MSSRAYRRCIKIYAFGSAHRCDPLDPHQQPITIVTTAHMQLFVSRSFCFPIVVPTATMSRMWEHNSRPAWAAVQGQRLEEGRGEQLRERETWHVAEAEKRKWSQWEHKSRWVWKEGDWKWSEWQGGEGWSWHPATWWYEEPTALEPTGASSSGWMEDQDETTLTPDHVHADMGTHRMTTLTPLSFQPQRHVTMVLGRPVVVLLCSEIHVASM